MLDRHYRFKYFLYLIVQKVLFQINKINKPFELVRTSPSNLDLISGNNFKDLCNLKINSISDLRILKTSSRDLKSKLLFYEISTKNFDALEFLQKNNFYNYKLICHNGDSTDHFKIIEKFKGQNIAIYSVNYIKNGLVIPLPIGLPNKLNKNYNKYLKLKEKKFYILINFTISTNPNIRNEILKKSYSSKYCVRLAWIPKYFYYEISAKFKFIVSPPGNGNDCHRTWEALSIGSIPVIQKGTLNQNLICEHILQVENFDDFFQMTRERLDVIYYEKIINNKICNHYQSEYWKLKIYEN